MTSTRQCATPLQTAVTLFLAAIVLAGTGSVIAATFTVSDAGDSGAGTLRQAIADANAAGGVDVIEFGIPAGQCDPSGVCTITLASSLPDVSEGVVVDGTTQPRYGTAPATVCATGMLPSSMRVLVSSADDYIFNITAAEPTTIRGLALAGGSATDGVRIHTYAGTTIQCNHFGLNGQGTSALDINSAICLSCYSGGGNAIIGADGDGVDDVGERNVFGAGQKGVNVNAGDSQQPSRISGNFFGLMADGRTSGDLTVGVYLRQSAGGNLIGTDDNGVSDELERNVFANCSHSGIWLNLFSSSENQIVGNWFGVDVHGCPAGNVIAIFVVGEGQNQEIRDNQLLWNWTGIKVQGSATLAAGSGQNCVSGNDTGLSHEGAAADLYAADNYWGAVDGPSGVGPGAGDSIVETGAGTVDFTPWLTSPHGVCTIIFSDGFESGGAYAWSLTFP